jgi:hypothetical protein
LYSYEKGGGGGEEEAVLVATLKHDKVRLRHD